MDDSVAELGIGRVLLEGGTDGVLDGVVDDGEVSVDQDGLRRDVDVF